MSRCRRSRAFALAAPATPSPFLRRCLLQWQLKGALPADCNCEQIARPCAAAQDDAATAAAAGGRNDAASWGKSSMLYNGPGADGPAAAASDGVLSRLLGVGCHAHEAHVAHGVPAHHAADLDAEALQLVDQLSRIDRLAYAKAVWRLLTGLGALRRATGVDLVCKERISALKAQQPHIHHLHVDGVPAFASRY